MSALWRINLLVVLFFSLVTAICMAMLLRQAGHDVRRELTAAQAVVEYLQQAALRDPGSLDAGLAGSLRHVRVRWLDGDLVSPVPAGPLDAWLGAWLYSMPANAEPLRLTDGRQVQIAVDPSDEIEEVGDSLVQLLQLFGLALLFSLLVIRWGVRQGLRVLDELLAGLHQVAQGCLQVRLPAYSRHESQLLAGHFNSMVATLEQVQADNGELTQALLTLQEHERKHLALALHDDLGQYLSGIRAQLLLLRSMTNHSDEVGQTLHRLEGNCQQMQESFRGLIRDLYPLVLERLQLDEALHLLTGQWQEVQGIRCELSLSARLPTLTASHQAHLYRLLQEALTNVARHARASLVRVRLRLRGRRLCLLVHDNGQGAAQLPRPGIGLRSMGERARCLGGEVRLRTRPGQGWLLRLQIPLEEGL